MKSGDFFRISKGLCSKLKSGEHLNLTLSSEDSQFIRFNASKVRQTGRVADNTLGLEYISESSAGLKRCTASVTLQGVDAADLDRALSALVWLREQIPALPVDPFAQKPKNSGSSEEKNEGKLLDPAAATDVLIGPMLGVDLAGFYASGKISVGMANSAGLQHWFETDNFALDYSLYTKSQRAVKGTYAGKVWNSTEFEKEISHSRSLLERMEKPAKKLERGTYRTYLAPAAFDEIVKMLSWGGISEGAIRQNLSPLLKVRNGEKKFSPLFSLSEDFRVGAVPRFNDEGELAPEHLALIARGKLENTLVSSRTALEYGVPSNAAAGSESLRSLHVAAGDLREEDVLKRLGTGLYLSNLHYLNWSDSTGGRITGMTRYACFWVEGGEIVAPIENLRFDESIFHILGDGLEALTQSTQVQPETGTYERRALGTAVVPGALLGSMQFTL